MEGPICYQCNHLYVHRKEKSLWNLGVVQEYSKDLARNLDIMSKGILSSTSLWNITLFWGDFSLLPLFCQSLISWRWWPGCSTWHGPAHGNKMSFPTQTILGFWDSMSHSKGTAAPWASSLSKTWEEWALPPLLHLNSFLCLSQALCCLVSYPCFYENYVYFRN